jgi:hypothetical protein
LPGLRQAILRLDGGHSLRALCALPALRELRFAAYCARARRCRHADLSEALSWLLPVSLRPLPPEILQHSAAPENRSVHDRRRLTERSCGLIAPGTWTRAKRKQIPRFRAENWLEKIACGGAIRPFLRRHQQDCRATPATGEVSRGLPGPCRPFQIRPDASVRSERRLAC